MEREKGARGLLLHSMFVTIAHLERGVSHKGTHLIYQLSHVDRTPGTEDWGTNGTWLYKQ